MTPFQGQFFLKTLKKPLFREEVGPGKTKKKKKRKKLKNCTWKVALKHFCNFNSLAGCLSLHNNDSSEFYIHMYVHDIGTLITYSRLLIIVVVYIYVLHLIISNIIKYDKTIDHY
jgi:hypothetical protein